MVSKEDIKKGTIVFLSRCMPTIGTFDVLELKVRTVEDNWFVGVEKSNKQAYLLPYAELNHTIFLDRSITLKLVQKEEKIYRQNGGGIIE